MSAVALFVRIGGNLQNVDLFTGFLNDQVGLIEFAEFVDERLGNCVGLRDFEHEFSKKEIDVAHIFRRLRFVQK